MEKKNKIAVLIPYFGEQPSWFDYFLLSCVYNSEIDWLFFTDCLSSEEKISNVKFFEMTILEFVALADSKLEFKTKLLGAYKLCDYKPAYGEIFSDYIQNYLFWGYGDIDLIYGDIMRFLPNNWENEFDIISNHRDFIPGHLCFVRNNEIMKKLYTKVNNYKEVFQLKNYLGFDERLLSIPINTDRYFNRVSKKNRIFRLLFFNRLLYYKSILYSGKILKRRDKNIKEAEPEDFTSLVQSLSRERIINARFSTTYSCDVTFSIKRIKKWKILWDKGKLIDLALNKEIMYFHFQISKEKKYFRVTPLKKHVNKFQVSSDGINCL